uniref:CUB domain-containing protein n=1 Tax=Panagrolaimus superbus TaxID=310955 RepID=A0A914YIM7_9BILA
MSGSSHFQIYNSTELLVNERSVKINHGYYNADNFIQINLMKDNVTTTQFNAYISVVKQNFAKLDGSCIVTNQINGSFTWASNANLSNGYDNNIVCNFAVIVPHGTSYLATVDQYSVETGVDHLNYDDGEYDFELNYHYQFVLESYSDGTNRTYFFEFITDGSYTASGFVISFVENGKCLKL